MPVEELLLRTVGRWLICPLWVLRGKMFTLAEKALIIALLDMWHTTNRPAWFYSTNKTLMRLAGISSQAFQNARHGLIKKCVIEYRRGTSHRLKAIDTRLASSYSISQDFLSNLSKDSNSPPLNTRTYSVGKVIDTSLRPRV
jgi:acyl CoA:acetate/3-ketoacid CoA transferase